MPSRISASSYSNTAPLIWSFLYGSQRGRVELILDNAPARSAELLLQGRVDAALVPVIAYHDLDVRLFPNVCVGAKEKVRSVCLVTRGLDLADVRTVALDVSSRTSVVLTKLIFREFLGFEPRWRPAEPNVEAMLTENDAALVIGDPALSIADCGLQTADFPAAGADPSLGNPGSRSRKLSEPNTESAIRNPQSAIRKFDLAELWNRYTGLGFVFAMWMNRGKVDIDFAAARDEGIRHLSEIVSNYEPEIGLSRAELTRYLSENISYSVDDSMQKGLELYFKLAGVHGLIESVRPIQYLE